MLFDENFNCIEPPDIDSDYGRWPADFTDVSNM